MSSLSHDQRAKRIVEQALDPFGDVTREYAVPSPDDQRGDLWFQRTRFPSHVPSYLRLFDRLFPGDAMIEAYSKAVPLAEFWASHRKQYNWFQSLSRRDTKLESPPVLWLFSAGRPEDLLQRFHFRPRPELQRGCYTLCQGFDVHLLVINELPADRETLIFRLMGAGAVLRAAAAELVALPATDPERHELQRFVACLRQTVRHDKNIPTSDRDEFTMTEAWAEFEKYEKNLINQGKVAGITQGSANTLLTVLKARGLALSSEVEQRIRSCTDEAQLTRWAIRAVSAASVDQIFDP